METYRGTAPTWPGMTGDDKVNQAAEFWAKTDPEGYPAIQVAGVTVFVYRDKGVMRISVDLDDHSIDTPMVDPDGEGRVPMDISVQGFTVYSKDDPGYPDVGPGGMHRGRRHSPGWAGRDYSGGDGWAGLPTTGSYSAGRD